MDAPHGGGGPKERAWRGGARNGNESKFINSSVDETKW